jgi:7-cyano-7-deazaguanine synthase
MSGGSVVLLSGGLDSATTLALAIREASPAHALSVRYGQRHEREIDRASRIAAALGASSHRIVTVDLSFLRGSALTDRSVEVPTRAETDEIGAEIPVTYVPARNTVFLSLALAWAESLGAGGVWIGANAVDFSGYPDCRPEFLDAFGELARVGTRSGVEGRAVEVRAPLLRRTKGEIVRLAVDLGVPIDLTISCYRPAENGRPCGSCESCRLRARGFAEAGVPDPAFQEPLPPEGPREPVISRGEEAGEGEGPNS